MVYWAVIAIRETDRQTDRQTDSSCKQSYVASNTVEVDDVFQDVAVG